MSVVSSESLESECCWWSWWTGIATRMLYVVPVDVLREVSVVVVVVTVAVCVVVRPVVAQGWHGGRLGRRPVAVS